MAASTWILPATLPLPRTSSSSLNPTKIPFPFNPANLSAHRPPPPTLPLKLLCSRNSKEVRFRPGQPDPVYKNRLIGMLVNRVMKGGKKSLAYHIIYLALKRIRAKASSSHSSSSNPLLVLRDAIREVTPDVTVKARRVGGSTHQVPVEVGSGQGKAMAIRWLIRASRKRHGKSMVSKLSEEVMDAARGSGEAVRIKEAAHKMAEANRAFAHFR